ncbi:hypothetical protein [Clostridium sp. DJ247]|uniref:hypothetical protein n=1 Tax=Clostridium sp. DJ247 TaxID=2726188 RepID=UPI0016255B7F|nr:hypothetical protein [Clostridium sp. DJ247]MBC2581715.1 hypothetical protein [Clostridium sp. DJ247]
MKITTLIENNSYDNSFLYNEHGLSFYIQVDNINIIFDTGQLIGVSHCTGEKAVEKLKYVFRDRFIYNNTGQITKFSEDLLT